MIFARVNKEQKLASKQFSNDPETIPTWAVNKASRRKTFCDVKRLEWHGRKDRLGYTLPYRGKQTTRYFNVAPNNTLRTLAKNNIASIERTHTPYDVHNALFSIIPLGKI